MVIKYSTTSVNNTIKINNIVFGINDVGYGPTVNTGFWNCITPPSSGYTIYTVSAGRPEPSIICPANDNETIGFAKYFGGTNINTITDALAYLITLTGTTIVNMDYPNIVTSGLSLNLDAGFVPSYPRTGTTWKDLSGYGNNGTLTLGPTFDSDNNGSIVFNGSTSYVNVPFNMTYFPYGNAARTLSAFFNASSVKAQEIFGIGGNSVAGGRTSLYLNNGLMTIECRNYGLVTEVTYNLGTWYNLTLVMPLDAYVSNMLVYVNGNFVTSTLFSTDIKINSETVGCTIGTIPGATAVEMFNGKISSVMLYNRALSASEVLQNFNALKSRYGL